MHIASNSNLKSYSIATFKRSLVVAKKHPENTVNGHGNQKNPCFTAGKERNKKGTRLKLSPCPFLSVIGCSVSPSQIGVYQLIEAYEAAVVLGHLCGEGLIHGLHLGVHIVCQTEYHGFDEGWLLGRSVFQLSVMGEYHVDELIAEPLGEAVDGCDVLLRHSGSYDDMAKELAFISIIILREGRKLAGLSYIVEQSSGDEEIPVDEGIMCSYHIAELGHAEGVLQEPSDEAVVYGLGSTVGFEASCKGLVIDKEAHEELL